MLDSLVRVSRRVEENHFVIIANPATDSSTAVFTFCTDRSLISHALGQTDHRVSYAEACGFSILSQSQCRTQGYIETEVATSPQALSPKILTDDDSPRPK